MTSGYPNFQVLMVSSGCKPNKDGKLDPLEKLVSMRLAYFRNRFVNFGDRVVLLNLVLNSIPMFFLSYIEVSWVK